MTEQTKTTPDNARRHIMGALEAEAAAWPDPTQPGVPLHPERDGYHWLRRRKGGGLDPWFWEAEQGGPGLGGWAEEGGDGAPADFERAFTYWAPCIPPEVPAHAR